MKKLISIILLSSLTFALLSCSSQTDSKIDSETETQSSTVIDNNAASETIEAAEENGTEADSDETPTTDGADAKSTEPDASSATASHNFGLITSKDQIPEGYSYVSIYKNKSSGYFNVIKNSDDLPCADKTVI